MVTAQRPCAGGEEAPREKLNAFFAEHPRLAIAFSGGLDSRFLCFSALRAGASVLALHARGPHIPEYETREAVDFAENLHLPLIVFDTDPLTLPDAVHNTKRRCYACKKNLLSRIRTLLAERGETERTLCDGTNHSDLAVFRPGLLALQEEGVLSPLALSGYDKPLIREKAVEENIPEVPGFFTQFFCLLGRRWRIFFRDRSQLVLQLVMVLLFPVLVAMFTDKGSGQIVGLSATQDVQTVQKDMEAQQLNMKTGSAVSGIIMFEVILLGLMGSNNAAREVAGERAVMEKEKYAGMRPSAYLASKLSYLSVLVLVQSVWMFAFVDFFWDRGGGLTHLLFLILANAAMTFVCLGISALARSADQASLLSIYLVGFQLPLSGAVLALPEYAEGFIRPFISAYWAWSGSISALKDDVYYAVKNVLDTDLTPSLVCYIVLGVHVACGIAAAYAGIRRSRWEL